MSDPKNQNGSPFASLAKLKDALPEGPTPEAEERAPEPAKIDPYAGKIVVTQTRKGRGGKTVTTVDGIRADAALRDTIARELRSALGCGAHVEGETIVISGKQSARVREWLEARGAKRIVIGG